MVFALGAPQHDHLAPHLAPRQIMADDTESDFSAVTTDIDRDDRDDRDELDRDDQKLDPLFDDDLRSEDTESVAPFDDRNGLNSVAHPEDDRLAVPKKRG